MPPAIAAQDLNFRIPPVTTSVGVQDVHIAIIASGNVSRIAKDKGTDVFRVDIDADLRELQQNLLPLLKAEMDRNEPCGDRIALQEATLVPTPPAGLLTAKLHYERYACAKALGKQIVKRLVGGNATLEVKLAPRVESHDSVKLGAEVTVTDADGSLGDILRSGDFGDKLREKIAASVQRAIGRVTDKNASLPVGLRDMATLDETRFIEMGTGGLGLQLRGSIRIGADQLRGLLGAAGAKTGPATP